MYEQDFEAQELIPTNDPQPSCPESLDEFVKMHISGPHWEWGPVSMQKKVKFENFSHVGFNIPVSLVESVNVNISFGNPDNLLLFAE